MAWTNFPISAPCLLEAKYFDEIRTKLNDLLEAAGIATIAAFSYPMLADESATPIGTIRSKISSLVAAVWFYDAGTDTFSQKPLAQVLTLAISASAWTAAPCLGTAGFVTEMKTVVQWLAANMWVWTEVVGVSAEVDEAAFPDHGVMIHGPRHELQKRDRPKQHGRTESVSRMRE